MGVSAMTTFDYDGRVFVSVDHAGDGAEPLRGHYHQRGDLVWAEITGGPVRHGRLAGTCDAQGVVRFAYLEVLTDGTIVVGECESRPERLPDGRIRLREQWRRHGPRQDSGVSVIEEAAPALAAGQESRRRV
ncbi:hypothetical protein DLJ60_02120 [Micromonospora chalcea]|uniref:N-acetylglutamate synthase n=2 Tax=Micromonosporaceae TaxID=28056 RepID=A0ABX9YD01_MICCH|nr:hypothetical protein [Micromonospora sp. C41]ODB78685.1 hypothetical protein A8711_01025 [Micromonospora sp. II]RQW97943.1 hypothetical protein DLJ60_02120 [Micromonospora chalcea]RQX23833.1 hypothetical protein DLJ57_24795 [Micromonospora chalcea]